jgi:hypothetical protein
LVEIDHDPEYNLGCDPARLLAEPEISDKSYKELLSYMNMASLALSTPSSPASLLLIPWLLLPSITATMIYGTHGFITLLALHSKLFWFINDD